MLQFLPPESPTLSSPAVHDSQFYLRSSSIQAEIFMDGSPRSSAGPSPTINLSRAYACLRRTDTYKEMWVSISPPHGNEEDQEDIILTQVLRPSRESVIDALRSGNSNTLTSLLSSYFQYSEETTSLCLKLRKSVKEARKLYQPLHTLIDNFSIESQSVSLSQSQCDLIFQEFLKFDGEENPFPLPDSHAKIRELFADLKRQLERRLRKSSSRIRLVRPATAGSSVCCVGTVCTAYIPPKFAKRELALAAQLKVASKNTYVLKTDLDTLDSIVGRLHTAIEADKRSIRLGVNMGNDKHSIQEVSKQLAKNHSNLIPFLDLLEEKICSCCTIVNRSRTQLHEEISVHKTNGSSNSNNS